jgi:acyl-CoA reductase-like NAD-dependent aldehyde dehydrogenase
MNGRRFDEILVGGAWIAAEGGCYPVVNPATEEMAGHAPQCSVRQVDNAVAAARQAFEAGPWPRMTATERRSLLDRAATRLADRSKDLLDLAVDETGALPWVIEKTHFALAVQRIGLHARIAASLPEIEVPPLDVDAGAIGAARSEGVVVRDPVGVVAVIAPYNAPVLVAMGKIAPALALGNTIVVKTPPAAPMALIEVCRILAEELPSGVVNLISGEGIEIGEALTGGDIDMVSFTGSSAVGRRIQEVCGQRMKRSLMELGGKSAAIFFADIDQERALSTAINTWLFQSGQACIAPTRLLIEESIYEELTGRMVEAAGRLAVGSPRDEGTILGPLISAAQRDRVESFVASAVEEGATIACGGRRPAQPDRGFYYEPTLITGVHNGMRVAREEVFGPVIVAIPFRTEEEAVTIANDSEYGLAGYVWSGDRERGIRVARRIRTGSVQVNGTPPRPDTPFGGFKQSGIGRDNGIWAVPAYTELKFIGWPAA